MPGTAASHQFSLVKGVEQFVVRCGAGQEEAAIGQLMEWAENPDLDFDWFDAAVLARQITQRVFSRATGQESELDADSQQN
jgi:hypothetical protein